MIYVHVANGVIDNRAVFSGVMPEYWPDNKNWFQEDIAQIGWRYTNGVFTPPAKEPEPAPSTDPKDYSLTAKQLRLGLIRNGISLQKVQDAIDALPIEQRNEAQVYWEFSTTVNWTHLMTQALLAASGITQEEAKVAWMAAKDYEA